MVRYGDLAAVAAASLAAARAQVEADSEADCSVCGRGDVGPGRQIVFCECCNVAVHQHVSIIEKSPIILNSLLLLTLNATCSVTV